VDKMKKRILGVLIALVMVSLLLVVPVQPVKAQFVIASWDYPDEYSQGIQQIRVNENSTGSWVLFDIRTYANESNSYIWEEGVGIQLYVWVWLNSTFTGASDLADGRNYHQCSVSVTQASGSVVFSQQNFTFQDENDYDDMYLYEYNIILNFIPQEGELYTITVTYEVYY